MLDQQLEKKMFRPDLKLRETRVTLASLEGVKGKRLLGALRTLWRSSNKYGQDDKITHLKSFLLPSPKRNPRHVGEHASDDDGGMLQDGGMAVEPPEPDSVESSLSQSSDGVGEDDISTRDTSDHEKGDDDDVDGSKLEPSSPNSSQSVDASELDVEVEPSSQNSDLNAPTLQLGEPSDAETSESEAKSENLRDSQVPGAGWLGRAMIHFRDDERIENLIRKEEQEIQRVLAFVKRDLAAEIGQDTLDKGWAAYEPRCRRAIKKQGCEAHTVLADPEFFYKWAFGTEDPCGFLGLWRTAVCG